LYNLLHVLGEDSEATCDSGPKIQQLQDAISQHKKDFGLKSFHTKKDSDGADADAIAGGACSASCAEFRLHGCEVQPEVIIVNEFGDVFGPLFKVWSLFST